MFGSMAAKVARRLALVFLAGVFVACAAVAQEQPKGEGSEHPKGQEHPKAEGKGNVSLEDLATAIQAYVENDSKLKGGYFLVYDPVAKKPLALELVKVHRDRLSGIGDQTYFACADFKSIDGAKTYDLDIFMKGPNKDRLMATQVLIHKEAGKERYSWYEEDGIWKRKEAGKS